MLARDLLTALFLVQGALGVSVPAEARGDIAFPERNIEQVDCFAFIVHMKSTQH